MSPSTSRWLPGAPDGPWDSPGKSQTPARASPPSGTRQSVGPRSPNSLRLGLPKHSFLFKRGTSVLINVGLASRFLPCLLDRNLPWGAFRNGLSTPRQAAHHLLLKTPCMSCSQVYQDPGRGCLPIPQIGPLGD